MLDQQVGRPLKQLIGLARAESLLVPEHIADQPIDKLGLGRVVAVAGP